MRLIDYGRIAKPQGLKGGLKIVPFSGDAEGLRFACRVFIGIADGGEPQSFDITESAVAGKSAVIKLAGVETKEDAEKFRGLRVMVAVSDLPETPEGEYYNFQLVGLLAVSENGAEIGKVESVLQSGMQSVLVISKKDGELLVPMVEKFVRDVDIEAGTVTVGNMEGLEDAG